MVLLLPEARSTAQMVDFLRNVDGIVTFGTVQPADEDDRAIAFEWRGHEVLLQEKVAANVRNGSKADIAIMLKPVR